MNTLYQTLQSYADIPLSTQVLLSLLQSYKRPYDKIDAMMSSGFLIQLRKGLYIVGPKVTTLRPEPFTLANHLYGPSYVTSLSALSYWECIPEMMRTVISGTLRKKKMFETPLGYFEYHNVSKDYFPQEVMQVALTDRQTVMIASVEKALCDLIAQTKGLNLRSQKQTLDFLLDDIRFDEHILFELNTNKLTRLSHHSAKSSSIQMVINVIKTK